MMSDIFSQAPCTLCGLPTNNTESRVHYTCAVRALPYVLALLDILADEEPCQLDHHGYCQAHHIAPGPCPTKEARAFLAGLHRNGTP